MIKMNPMKYLGGLAVALLLSACGGGSPTAATGPNTAPTAADVVFELDKATINNTGVDVANLTVSVLDASRNVVVGVPVRVSLSPDGIFQKNGGDVTDSKGQLVGQIAIGSNKSNRVISATITVGTLSRVASVQVTGSQIVLTPVPAVPAPGQSVRMNIETRDSAGVAIPNVTLALSGVAGVPASVTTDFSGNAVVTFTAPTSPGEYIFVASALGASAPKPIQVVSAASGKPAASGTVSSASLTPIPSLIKPNRDGRTTNRSKLSAKFQTAANAGIENMRVRFEIEQPRLDNNESISTDTATVFTNAAGIAEADYIAGIRTSPTNGVKVRICYSPNDFVSATDCPNETSIPSIRIAATLTVAGEPLSISIGDDNLLSKGLGNIAYIKKFLIQVNDAAGVAVPDAIVSASVDITHYGKGFAWASPYSEVQIPNINNVHPDFPVTRPPNALVTLNASNVGPLRPTVSPAFAGSKVWCLNEDLNRNGFLDMGLGEDLNGDGSIQPKKAEVIVSYVNGNKTDASGQLLVQVSYPQNMGGWLAYTLRATTGVAGSEGDAAKSYVTDVIQGDVTNGSFQTPPFGSNSCRVPG
jgi:hypothetical protein